MLDKVSEVTGNWHLGQNCAFLICKLAIYHETMDFSIADRTNVFLSFLVVCLTLGQFLLLTALVLCLSIR